MPVLTSTLFAADCPFVCTRVSFNLLHFHAWTTTRLWGKRRKEFRCDEHSVTPFFFFFLFFFFYCFLLLSNRRRRRDERAEKGDVALSEACLTEIADNLSLPPSLSLTSSILSAENCDVQGRVLLSCCLGNRCNAQRVVLPGSCHT